MPDIISLRFLEETISAKVQLRNVMLHFGCDRFDLVQFQRQGAAPPPRRRRRRRCSYPGHIVSAPLAVTAGVKLRSTSTRCVVPEYEMSHRYQGHLKRPQILDTAAWMEGMPTESSSTLCQGSQGRVFL